MESLPLGPLEAIFKVIEERLPLGRQLTTVASALIVLTVIVFCGGYLASVALSIFGYMPRFSIGLPFSLDWSFRAKFTVWFIALWLAIMWALADSRYRRGIEKRDEIERLERIITLLNKLVQANEASRPE
jgi:hypothetical protein